MYKKILSALILLLFMGCSSHHYTPHAHTSPARYKATMRTYTVHGKRYSPTYVAVGDTMKGIASWYGPKFNGCATSNGECYDMNAHTAAHKTWPMDTMVKVENLRNGKSTIVRINDRGPFVANRIIDCSYAAAKDIGLDKSGTAPVKLTVIGFAGKVYSKKSGKPLPKIKLGNFGVQVGAFRNKAGAQRYKWRYSSLVKAPKDVIIREFNVDGSPLYRVWVMGFGSEDEAKDFISKNSINGAFLIRP